MAHLVFENERQRDERWSSGLEAAIEAK